MAKKAELGINWQSFFAGSGTKDPWGKTNGIWNQIDFVQT